MLSDEVWQLISWIQVQMRSMPAQVSLRPKFCLHSQHIWKWQGAPLFSVETIWLHECLYNIKKTTCTDLQIARSAIYCHKHASFIWICQSFGFIAVPRMEQSHISACIRLHSACCQSPYTHSEKDSDTFFIVFVLYWSTPIWNETMTMRECWPPALGLMVFTFT